MPSEVMLSKFPTMPMGVGSTKLTSSLKTKGKGPELTKHELEDMKKEEAEFSAFHGVKTFISQHPGEDFAVFNGVELGGSEKDLFMIYPRYNYIDTTFQT